MRVPSAKDIAKNIRRAGKGAWLFSCDVARAYHQIPLDPADWPLICLSEGGWNFMAISLLFGMKWAAASCQDVTAIIACHHNHRGFQILNYTDDFGRVDSTKEKAQLHFYQLQATLDALDLVKAKQRPPQLLSR